MSTGCAVNYVRQHLDSKITVDNVASRCGMSKSHFSRTFKKEHDITFQDFLIQQRMNKAVKMLKNSDLHVTQIALAVGYGELSNFTSTFQRTIGIRPSSFRKALMPNHFKNQLYNWSVLLLHTIFVFSTPISLLRFKTWISEKYTSTLLNGAGNAS